MPDEAHVDTEELRRLGDAFTTCAYDLGRYLSAFRARTDAEALRDAFGRTAGSAPGVAELGELSEVMGVVIGRLQDRFDEIGSGMKDTVRNSAAADEMTATMIEGIR